MSTPISNMYRLGVMLATFSLTAALMVTALSVAPAAAATTTGCARGVNLSFEEPVIPDTWRPIDESLVPGWETNAPDGAIELWVDGFLGFSATDGNQLSELQASGTAPVYQDIPTVEGDVIAWTVDHRGRAAVEEARVEIGAPGAEVMVQQMVTSPDQWITYAGAYTVPAGQAMTRFMLRPIGSGSVGNLVDNVTISLTCGLSADTTAATVTDSDGSGSGSSGDEVTVTTSVTNTGTATLLELGLSDSAAVTASCLDSTLLPGQATICTATYTMDQAAVDSGAFSGTAVVSGRDAAGVSISDDATYSVSLAAEPGFDVVLEATLDESIVSPPTRSDVGDAVLFSGTVTNTGNVTLTDVAVSTDLTGPLTCTTSTITPTASTICTASRSLTQTDIDSGAITAVGSFSSVPALGDDLVATASASVAIAPDSVPAVTYSADHGSYDALGGLIVLAVTVANQGNTTLHDVVVTEDLGDVGTLDCGGTPFTLSPAEERTCTATRSVKQSDLDTGRILGFATVTGEDPTGGSVSVTSAELVLIATQYPSIAVTAASTLDLTIVSPLDRADVGDLATVAYTVTNTGNVTLSAVALGVSLPSPLDCPSTGLAPGESEVCAVTFGLSQTHIDSGEIDVSASVTATATDGSTVSSATTHALTIDRVPGVDIETTSDDITSSGDGTYTIDYTVAVRNVGNTTLSAMNVLDGLMDTFPDATVTLVSWTPDLAGPFSPTLVLQPGDTVSAAYVVEVNSGGDPGPYTTVSAVTATSPTGDASDESSLDVQLDVSYDLVVAHAAPTSAAPGSIYSHVFTVTNIGPAAAYGPIVLTMSLDPSTPFKSHRGDGWTCALTGAEVTCIYEATLNANSSTEVAIDVIINAEMGATPASTVQVTASDSSNDSDPSTNVLGVTLQVTQLPLTGLEAESIALVGLLLLLVGGTAVLTTHRTLGE